MKVVRHCDVSGCSQVKAARIIFQSQHGGRIFTCTVSEWEAMLGKAHEHVCHCYCHRLIVDLLQSKKPDVHFHTSLLRHFIISAGNCWATVPEICPGCWAAYHRLDHLQRRGNYSASSNNTKSVHWPLMGGLLHLVQRGGAVTIAV